MVYAVYNHLEGAVQMIQQSEWITFAECFPYRAQYNEADKLMVVQKWWPIQNGSPIWKGIEKFYDLDRKAASRKSIKLYQCWIVQIQSA